MEELDGLSDEALEFEREELLQDLKENRNRLCARAKNTNFLGLRDHRERMPIARPQKHLVTAAIRKRQTLSAKSDADTEVPQPPLAQPVIGGEHVAHVALDKPVLKMAISDGPEAQRELFVAMSITDARLFWMDRLGSDVFVRYDGIVRTEPNNETFLDVALSAKGNSMAILSEIYLSPSDRSCSIDRTAMKDKSTQCLKLYNIDTEPLLILELRWSQAQPVKGLLWLKGQECDDPSVVVAGDNGSLEVFCFHPSLALLKYRKVVSSYLPVGRLVHIDWIPALSMDGVVAGILGAVFALENSNPLVVWHSEGWKVYSQAYTTSLYQHLVISGVLVSPSGSTGIWGLVSECDTASTKGVVFETENSVPKELDTIHFEGKDAKLVLLRARPTGPGSHAIVVGVDQVTDACRLTFIDLNNLQVSADLLIPATCKANQESNFSQACIGLATSALTLDGQTVHFLSNPRIEEVT